MQLGSVFSGQFSVDRNNKALRILLCLIALFLVTRSSSLVTEVKAEDRFNVKYQSYEDDQSLYYKDTDGVKSDRWIVSIAKSITEKTSIALNYGVDAVSSASWKVDGVTSASKRAGEETRYSGGLGVNHNLGTSTVSYGIGLSRENNYNSDFAYATIGKEFNKRNTNITLSVSKAWDDVYSAKIGESRSFPRSKDTSNVGLSVSQLLTPWTIAVAGYDYSMVDGYQAHAENTVYLSDTSAYVNEVHPESRSRNAGVLRLVQYVPWKGAIHADYRYYSDSWGVDSNTIGLKYYHYLYDDLIVRVRYRYYSQGEADFYSENPTSTDRYPTIDGKLRDFDSKMYGIKVIYDVTKYVGKAGLDAVEKAFFDIKYDRYQQADAITSASKNGDGLKADILQLGIGMEF